MSQTPRTAAVTWKSIAAVVVPILMLASLVLGAARFSIGALDDPGALETSISSAGKRWFVRREAGKITLPDLPHDEEKPKRGMLIYIGSCNLCHGYQSRRIADFGLYMSPRAPVLDVSLLAKWSDEELFWITKYGIRMTGMPGFGKIHSDREILSVIRFLRSVSAPDRSSESDEPE